ncbi:restriction endonuclease subunit S [Priestia megaterium]
MEFNRYSLEEVCTLITDGSHVSPKAVEVGYDMLSVKDMQDFDFNYSNSKKISEADYLQLVKNNCQPIKDDVLIAKDGNSCLESCFVFKDNKPVVLLSSIAILRSNREIIDPYYLMYLLRLDTTKKALKDGYLSGSAIPRVVLKDFKKFPLYLPSLKEQKKIVSIIYNINNKIENNHEIISICEKFSQTLFKQWFIDFEFPNEEGKPYKSSGGEMVESELGEIPKGWDMKSLDEIAKFQNGLAMQKFRPEESEESLPVLKIKELNQGSTTLNSERCSTKIKEDVKVFDGDVIFSWSGTLLVKLWTGGDAGLNQHLFKVTSGKYEKWFYYLWTKYYLRVFQARASEKATTMGHIKRSHLKEAKVYLPSQEILIKASKILKPITENIITSGIENKKLEQLRDTLLPKLLSGEIEIPDELEV